MHVDALWTLFDPSPWPGGDQKTQLLGLVASGDAPRAKFGNPYQMVQALDILFTGARTSHFGQSSFVHIHSKFVHQSILRFHRFLSSCLSLDCESHFERENRGLVSTTSVPFSSASPWSDLVSPLSHHLTSPHTSHTSDTPLDCRDGFWD